jgi:hypothetical protein
VVPAVVVAGMAAVATPSVAAVARATEHGLLTPGCHAEEVEWASSEGGSEWPQLEP